MAKLTRKQFIADAIRSAERRVGVPAGWWGTWSRIYSPSGMRAVRTQRRMWIIRDRHDKIINRSEADARGVVRLMRRMGAK